MRNVPVLMQHIPGFMGRDFLTPVLTPLFAFPGLGMISSPCFYHVGSPT